MNLKEEDELLFSSHDGSVINMFSFFKANCHLQGSFVSCSAQQAMPRSSNQYCISKVKKRFHNLFMSLHGHQTPLVSVSQACDGKAEKKTISMTLSSPQGGTFHF